MHCGLEALKVKNSVQTAYRERSGSAKPSSWESVSEDVLQRAHLLLACADAAAGPVPKLEPADEVITWQQEHADTDIRCQTITSVRKFLVEGPKVALVREILAARRVALHDADCGYSGALALLEAGVIDDDTGLTRSPTVEQASFSGLELSGTWQLSLDGDLPQLSTPIERPADAVIVVEGAGNVSWNGYYKVGGRYNNKDKFVKVGATGAFEPGDKPSDKLFLGHTGLNPWILDVLQTDGLTGARVGFGR